MQKIYLHNNLLFSLKTLSNVIEQDKAVKLLATESRDTGLSSCKYLRVIALKTNNNVGTYKSHRPKKDDNLADDYKNSITFFLQRKATCI